MKVFAKKILFGLAILFTVVPAKADELRVESQIYSSSKESFTGADLFRSTLPNELVANLEKVVKKVKVEAGKSVKYKREAIRQLIWKVIQEYRKKTGERLQVSFPNEVEVFSFQDRLNLENLKKRVKLMTKSECPTCDIEVQLKDDINLSYVGLWEIETSNDNWKGEVELKLKTDRVDAVPAVIRWKDKVVVAKRSIHAGSVIKESDLKTNKKDVTFLKSSYINDKKKLVSRMSRKNFRVNQMISMSATKKANVIRYGESVALHFVDKVLTVTASAKAKGAGAVGDLIPIYIPRTKRKMMARVVDKGKVRVE